MADQDDQDDGAEALKDPRSTRHDHPETGGNVQGPHDPPSPSKDDNKKKGGKDKDDKDKDGKKKDDRPAWPLFVAAALVILFIFIILLIIFAPHGDVRTDDAYVTAHFSTVAPRVSGQVQSVNVNDNQPVHAGQLLATLDPRDYQTAVLDAQAQLQSDEARRDQAAAEVARQPALIAQAQSQVASATARLAFSVVDARRYTNLAATGSGTVQQRQQADTAVRQDAASLASAQAELAAQSRQLAALQAAEAAAASQAQGDASRLTQAQLNLGYTRITAPMDGYIDQRTAQVGDYVSPGAALMTVVPLNRAYILANYRELALRHMAPGQHVRIHLDAYNVDLDGVVNSIPPASSATFSPVPPNNATGNFTKIVQRLPVKITVTPGQPKAKLLRVGMSVETTVHTGLADVVADQAHSRQRVTSP